MRLIRKKVKNFLRYFNYHILWRIIFRFNCLFPIDKKLIMFADTHSTTLTDNMQCLYDELLKDNKYKFKFFLAPKITGNKIKDLFTLYVGFMRFSRFYARCNTLILTDSYLPAFANKPRKNTTVIQLWHGCGAFKKWGYSTADSGWGASRKRLKLYPLHNCYTKVCVSSPDIIPFYAQAFNCNESIIKPIGVPRTDKFFNEQFIKDSKEKLLNEIPQSKDKKIILYAPTFRGKNVKLARTDNEMDYELLKENISDRYILINKLHPFISNSLLIDNKYNDFVFNAPKSMDISQLLCCSDIVISDYSSLIFEFSLFKKPMIFYSYDLESYDKERSFYYPYKEFVPGDIVYNTDEIIKSINQIESDFDSKIVEDFCNKFMSACDGNSTQRVLKLIT